MILVFEDNVPLYQRYLRRVLGDLLERAKVTWTMEHVSTPTQVIERLSQPGVAVALLDYDFRPLKTVTADGPLLISNGADLVRTIIAIQNRQKMAQTVLYGMATHPMGQDKLMRAGTASAFEKVNLEAVAAGIRDLFLRAGQTK